MKLWSNLPDTVRGPMIIVVLQCVSSTCLLESLMMYLQQQQKNTQVDFIKKTNFMQMNIIGLHVSCRVMFYQFVGLRAGRISPNRWRKLYQSPGPSLEKQRLVALVLSICCETESSDTGWLTKQHSITLPCKVIFPLPVSVLTLCIKNISTKYISIVYHISTVKS